LLGKPGNAGIDAAEQYGPSLRLAAWASHIQCFCFWNDFLANLIYIK